MFADAERQYQRDMHNAAGTAEGKSRIGMRSYDFGVISKLRSEKAAVGIVEALILCSVYLAEFTVSPG